MYKPILAALVMIGCGSVSDSGSSGGPSITSISPDHGSILGGTEVTITGSNLDDGTAQVLVGGVLATDVMASSGSTLTFTSPAATREGDELDITIFNDGGHATLRRAYRINEQPTVISISPERGRGAGGTVVTITGRGFQALEAGAASVKIDGTAATNVMVVDDRTLMATLGASPMSPAFEFVDVEVTNANGITTLSGAFQLTQPGLLALNGNNVVYIDVRTGKTTQLVRLDRSVRRCAALPSGMMVGWARNNTNSNRELVTFSPFAETVTTLGSLTANRSLGGFAVQGGNVFGMTTDNAIGAGNPHVNNLVSVNMTNGTLTNIGAAFGFGTGGGNSLAATTRDASSMWVIKALNASLDHVNTTTGARTVGPTLQGNANSDARGAAMVGNTLWVSDRNTAQLFSVDTTTGALTRLATQPLSGVSAICETPATF